MYLFHFSHCIPSLSCPLYFYLFVNPIPYPQHLRLWSHSIHSPHKIFSQFSLSVKSVLVDFETTLLIKTYCICIWLEEVVCGVLVIFLAPSVLRSKVIILSCGLSWGTCNVFYSEHTFLQHETLTEIQKKNNKKFTMWMRISRSFAEKILEVNQVEKQCPTYFKVKMSAFYLLPQYKPWWGHWRSGSVVSLAGCGAALHPASRHSQDMGICRRTPGKILSFISLKNRSSTV